MSRRISVSRAARLVGVKRGSLQQKIRAGEISTFEGEIALSDLLQAYPKTTIEDTSMLERVEQIMEQASFVATSSAQHKPSNSALASRILTMSQQLARQQRVLRGYKDFIELLKLGLEQLKLDNDLAATDDKALNHFFGLMTQAMEGLRQNESAINESLGNEVFLRIMTAQATIIPSGHEFFIEGSDSILEAGLRGGLGLNYGCSNGNCGLCKMRVVSGETRKLHHHDFTLTETEKNLGYLLSCSHTAVTDVVLEASEAKGSFDIPLQAITIRRKKIEQSDSTIVIINARTPRTRRLRFLAGQQVTLNVDHIGSKRYYIASCPCDDMNLQFHIDRQDDDPLSKYLCDSKTNDSISLNGPEGSFTLDENSPNSLVFIAQKNGFAPVKGLIEHAMALDSAENIYLYWVSDIEPKHYLNNLCRSWNDALDNFHYFPIDNNNSVQNPDSICERLQANHAEFKNLDFYLCAEQSLMDKIVPVLDSLTAASCRLTTAAI